MFFGQKNDKLMKFFFLMMYLWCRSEEVKHGGSYLIRSVPRGAYTTPAEA